MAMLSAVYFVIAAYVKIDGAHIAHAIFGFRGLIN